MKELLLAFGLCTDDLGRGQGKIEVQYRGNVMFIAK